MGIALTTAGVTLLYAVEGTVKTRPTTGYKNIPDVKEIPEMNPAPSTLESTPLSNRDYKQYVPGLKDLGGALSFMFNLNDALMLEWDKIITESETAKAAGKQMWFNIKIPGMAKDVFFPGEPSKIGSPGLAVDSIVEVSAFITPTGEPVWETPSTASASL